MSPLALRSKHIQPWFDIPVAKVEDGSRASRSSQKSNARKGYTRLAEEIEEHLVGPMPVKKFMDFLVVTPNDIGMPSHKNAFEDVPLKGQEGELNGPLVSRI